MNDALRSELEGMRRLDQAVREEAMGIARTRGLSSPEYEAIRKRGKDMDQAHSRRLICILQEHGWPGVSLVGEMACVGAFLLLQHAEHSVQKQFLPLVQRATDSGEIPRQFLPLLEDRVRMMDGQKQVYGTQVTRDAAGNAQLWPIEDEAHVDERRAGVGLEPLSEYLKRFGIGA